MAEFIYELERDPDQDLAYNVVQGLLLEIPLTMDVRINAYLTKLGATTRLDRKREEL